MNENFSINFFDTVEELEEITSRSEQELWDLGFNLDDMDCGCCFKATEYIKVELDPDEPNYKRWQWVHDIDSLYYEGKAPFFLYRLLNDWDLYCAGYCLASIGDYIFITLHHA